MTVTNSSGKPTTFLLVTTVGSPFSARQCQGRDGVNAIVEKNVIAITQSHLKTRDSDFITIEIHFFVQSVFLLVYIYKTKALSLLTSSLTILKDVKLLAALFTNYYDFHWTP